MVGISTSRMKETKLPVSHPRSWYAQWSSLVTGVFLKKSVSSGISLSAILLAPRVGEEEATIAVLFAPESCPESSLLTDETRQQEKRGHGQWCQPWSSKR
jgi:hypothetical protein